MQRIRRRIIRIGEREVRGQEHVRRVRGHTDREIVGRRRAIGRLRNVDRGGGRAGRVRSTVRRAAGVLDRERESRIGLAIHVGRGRKHQFALRDVACRDHLPGRDRDAIVGHDAGARKRLDDHSLQGCRRRVVGIGVREVRNLELVGGVLEGRDGRRTGYRRVIDQIALVREVRVALDAVLVERDLGFPGVQRGDALPAPGREGRAGPEIEEIIVADEAHLRGRRGHEPDGVLQPDNIVEERGVGCAAGKEIERNAGGLHDGVVDDGVVRAQAEVADLNADRIVEDRVVLDEVVRPVIDNADRVVMDRVAVRRAASPDVEFRSRFRKPGCCRRCRI